MKNQILTDNNKIILQTTDYKKVSAIPIGTGALIDYAVVGRIADFCFFYFLRLDIKKAPIASITDVIGAYKRKKPADFLNGHN